MRLNRRLQMSAGALLLGVGLAGDCLVGARLLSGGTWQLLAWHLPLALLWAGGVHLVTRREASRVLLNRWGLTALLVGIGTFPGFGSGMYSLALLVTGFSQSHSSREAAPPLEERPDVLASEPETVAQPLVDALYQADLEVRRLAIAKISRTARPATTRLLRPLLADRHATIRSDASIALARMDDEMSQTLHRSFEAWSACPTDPRLALALAEQYYAYAASNILDRQSQRLYLALARDLFLQVSASPELQTAQLWLQLARTRELLGEYPEALRATRSALQLQPDLAEASLSLMELAFRAHAWETLIAAASESIERQTLARDNPALTVAQWWATLHVACLWGGPL